MPWSKALSRGGDQNMFTGLQYSQSHGGCHYTGLILFPSVLGKTVISRFLFRFVFKTQYNALETKAPKTLQLNSYLVHWRRIKKEPFFSPSPFPLPVLPKNAFVDSSKASIRPASLHRGWRVQEREKVRQALQEDPDGSESACTAQRVHKVKGQKSSIK